MSTPIVFFGTPAFAVPFLEALIHDSGFDVRLVLTQPDRPVGRSRTPQPTPVKVCAEKNRIPCITPETLKDPAIQTKIKEIGSTCFVVVAYGNLLPQSVLDIPSKGSLNVHFSLLPKYRGASPIETAILHGDTETGVTIMLLDAGMDTGDILAQQVMPIAPQETKSTLRAKLTVVGAELLQQTLKKWLLDEIKPTKQLESQVVITALIKKEDGIIDWENHNAVTIDRMIRAYEEWPGVATMWNGKRLALEQISVTSNSSTPGHVTKQEDQILIGTKNGSIVLHRVQLEGKQSTDIASFVRGYPTFVGAVLGQ